MSTIMIRAYSDNAADERTFLAWVRTGFAIMSLGIVIEKFGLFIQAMTIPSSPDPMRLKKLVRLTSLFQPDDSLAFIAGGLALIAIQLSGSFATSAYWMTPRRMQCVGSGPDQCFQHC
jgi:putative membrane protein